MGWKTREMINGVVLYFILQRKQLRPLLISGGILNSAIWPRNNINIADENARFHLNTYFYQVHFLEMQNIDALSKVE